MPGLGLASERSAPRAAATGDAFGERGQESNAGDGGEARRADEVKGGTPEGPNAQG